MTNVVKVMDNGDKTEFKIGMYFKSKITDILTNIDIDTLTSSEFSSKIGISKKQRFLVEESMIEEFGGKPRYYQTLYCIGSVNYFVNSQWFMSKLDMLMNTLKEYSLVTAEEYDSIMVNFTAVKKTVKQDSVVIPEKVVITPIDKKLEKINKTKTVDENTNSIMIPIGMRRAIVTGVEYALKYSANKDEAEKFHKDIETFVRKETTIKGKKYVEIPIEMIDMLEMYSMKYVEEHEILKPDQIKTIRNSYPKGYVIPVEIVEEEIVEEEIIDKEVSVGKDPFEDDNDDESLFEMIDDDI